MKFSHQQVKQAASSDLETQNLDILEEMFWEYFPHNNSWSEFELLNEELYKNVQKLVNI